MSDIRANRPCKVMIQCRTFQMSYSKIKDRECSCISVRMPDELVAELDAEARKNGCSTSQIVRELLRLALDVRHDGR
jgi:hypothetical protein